jgi:hypothetical protein
MVLVAFALVSTESMFCGFIRCKVDGMRGSCVAVSPMPQRYRREEYSPAPKITLESPFHSDLKPSTLETVTRALAMEFW